MVEMYKKFQQGQEEIIVMDKILDEFNSANMKVLVYGVGQRFFNGLFYEFVLPEIILDADKVCVSDKDINKIQRIGIPCEKRTDAFKNYDIIIVTTDKYFEEIKNELILNYSVNREKILSIGQVEKSIIRKKFMTDLFLNLSGVEVGGPSYLFNSNIYDVMKECDGINFSHNTVWWNDGGNGYLINGIQKGQIIISDVTDLKQIADEKYDFCISSNILEHTANPIKALYEMKRIIKKKGYVLTVVPNKDTCFDHRRNITSFIHLLDDYKKDVDEKDMTHIDEIINKHDYQMDDGITSKHEFIERSEHNFENRCLHHHVFDENLLRLIYRYLGLEILSSGKIYSNWYVIGRKT